MRWTKVLSTIGLLLVGALIGRAQDGDPPPATVSPMPQLERADGQLVGGLHLPSGGMVQTTIYLGKPLNLTLPAGDYLVFDPVSDDGAVWLVKAGTIVKQDKLEGPKIFTWASIQAEYVDRAEAAQPRLVDIEDGWRAAEYPLPDGRAVRIRLMTK